MSAQALSHHLIVFYIPERDPLGVICNQIAIRAELRRISPGVCFIANLRACVKVPEGGKACDAIVDLKDIRIFGIKLNYAGRNFLSNWFYIVHIPKRGDIALGVTNRHFRIVHAKDCSITIAQNTQAPPVLNIPEQRRL